MKIIKVLRNSVLVLILLHCLALWQTKKMPRAERINKYLKHSPQQSPTSLAPIRWQYKGRHYVANVIAKYQLFGLVMSKNNINSISDIYHDNNSVDTKDFCLMWGENLSDDIIENVRFKNTAWTCHVNSKNQNIWEKFSLEQFSNNHIITDNQQIREKIERINLGDQIYLSGYLVNYYDTAHPELVRKSSTTRADTGNQACEVFFVDQIKILAPANEFWNTYKRASTYFTPLMLIAYLVIFIISIQPKYIKE